MHGLCGAGSLRAALRLKRNLLQHGTPADAGTRICHLREGHLQRQKRHPCRPCTDLDRRAETDNGTLAECSDGLRPDGQHPENDTSTSRQHPRQPGSKRQRRHHKLPRADCPCPGEGFGAGCTRHRKGHGGTTDGCAQPLVRGRRPCPMAAGSGIYARRTRRTRAAPTADDGRSRRKNG